MTVQKETVPLNPIIDEAHRTVDGPPREPTEAMINAIRSTHRPGWAVSWSRVWTTMYDAWHREHQIAEIEERTNAR